MTTDAPTLADSVELIGTTVATAPATRPEALGAHLVGDGVDVVVSAPHADAVWLCLLRVSGAVVREERVGLLPAQHGRWHAHVPGVRAGQRYGLRVEGPWDPEHGMRHNPHRLLLDPYARGVEGQVRLGPELYPHVVDADLRPVADDDSPDTRDSAPFVPHGVVLDDHYGGSVHARPRTSWSRTVIYEAHVRGLTMRLPGVPEELRGTYAGLAHPVTVAHLRELGVTAVELLPIHAKMTEPELTRRGVVNYWGYSTLAYLAPEPSYATAAARLAGAGAVLHEVKGMVELLHEAGIEVLLDVVYNHTCEAGADGPSVSWRGLDDRYYLREAAGPQRYLDTTGCGNALDFTDPRVVQLALDSLRYWVTWIGVDGFRFDLAVTLARRGAEVDMSHPFLVGLATDPVLSGVKLIAEPWDLGPDGWQTGRFPAPLAEWNDRYRDCVRTFWLTDVATMRGGGQAHDLRDLATRLAGSADLFSHTAVPGGRGPVASINYVTAHDGFTLADLVAYDVKRNESNGEHNRDGSDHNRSWNHGVEGPTRDAEVLAARRRTTRNVLGTMLVSAGVPMLTAGDEIARTQRGNNNGYCLDDDRVWVDWRLGQDQRDLLATVQHLTALRAAHPVLRPWRFRRPDEQRSGRPTLAWFDADGEPMSLEAWHDAGRRVVQMRRLGPEGERNLLLVVNGGLERSAVRVPDGGSTFALVWDSTWERPEPGAGVAPVGAGDVIGVDGLSLQVHLSVG